jgi:hypothetical protein
MKYTILKIFEWNGLVAVIARIGDPVYVERERIDDEGNIYKVTDCDEIFRVIYFEIFHTLKEIKFCFDIVSQCAGFKREIKNTYNGTVRAPWKPANREKAQKRVEELREELWQP